MAARLRSMVYTLSRPYSLTRTYKAVGLQCHDLRPLTLWLLIIKNYVG